MPSSHRKRILFAAAIAAGMLLVSSAAAWYGGPWYRPYGAGAMTYERQNTMRDHRYAMEGLTAMLAGRRAFNRDAAVRLARDVEAGFGKPFLGNYAPGSWVAGSRTAPWTWRHYEAFKGLAANAERAAGELADALAQQPSGDDIRQKGVWLPATALRHGRGRLVADDLVSMEAVEAYGRLNATCHTCHASFRGLRW